MDNGSSDHSLPSNDSATGSLLMKLWDKESNRSSSLGLHNLVEDKDIAAKAVTLVVNSSRKGVVSLCADVANILRAKKKLEQTLELQQKDLLKLRRNCQLPGSGSNRTSRSTSPTPPSFMSYDSASLSHHRNSSHKTSSHSSSRCSHCSSLSSSSSRMERALNQSTVSTESHDSGTHHHSSTELLPNQYRVTAEVHPAPSSECSSEDEQVNTLEFRRKSIETFSKEVQCSSLSDEKRELEMKYKAVCSEKAGLEEDLQKAKLEADDLRERLCITEAFHEEQSKICGLRIENEQNGNWSEASKTDNDDQLGMSINLPLLNQTDSRRHSNPHSGLISVSRPISANPHPPSQPRRQSPPHPPAPHLVLGCLCMPCQKLQQEGARQGTPSQGHTVIRGINHRFTIHLDDHIATKGDKTGFVRYIGHLDNANSPHTVYAGLELDAPVGRHDGIIHGKRYFSCHRNHGLFVPVQDIVAIIKKPTKRPKTVNVSNRHGSSGPDYRHQKGSYSMDLKLDKSGHHTSSGKRLLSADSNSLKQKRNLPTPSVT